ncbi:hypothetical protein SAMN05444374_110121 [Rhodococcoides kroppenstedtii]|uniref:Uncharacterized protein n=1 Tax=Rhodococcoides kroppenstedtii TaxID=293050 RepID=A0A1I0TWZ5_9NOCA|nr:hypothetical protein SAMN05444374_110121 [Rhodococcus kroppenstedtii]
MDQGCRPTCDAEWNAASARAETQPRPIDDAPPWAVGEREVLLQFGVRQDDDMGPREPLAQRPSWVVLHVGPERVLRFSYLCDRVDRVVHALTRLHPGRAVVRYLPALDLHTHDTETVEVDHEVDLVVLVVVGDPPVRQNDVVLAELVDERFVDGPLSTVHERRGTGNMRHRTRVPSRSIGGRISRRGIPNAAANWGAARVRVCRLLRECLVRRLVQCRRVVTPVG